MKKNKTTFMRVCPHISVCPCFAEPPTEFPSTMKISDSEGSFDEQSASFPGSEPTSNVFFLSTSSLAFLAASLALLDITIFSITLSYLKTWAPRSYKPLVLRAPVLTPGRGRALRADATKIVDELEPVDLAYLDPPYNQHH